MATVAPFEQSKDSGKTHIGYPVRESVMQRLFGKDYKSGAFAPGVRLKGDGWIQLQPGNNMYYGLYPDGSYYPLLSGGGVSATLRELERALPDLVRINAWDWRGTYKGKPTSFRWGYVNTDTGGFLSEGLGALVGAMFIPMAGMTGATLVENALTGDKLKDDLGRAVALDAAGAAAVGAVIAAPAVGGAASTGGSLVSTQGTSGAIMTTVEKAISTVVSSVVATGTKALQGALAGDSAAPKPPVSNAAGAPLLSPGMLVLGALALALVLMPSRR